MKTARETMMDLLAMKVEEVSRDGYASSEQGYSPS
jgi:hypothetical protein